jgi:hypothetical protein
MSCCCDCWNEWRASEGIVGEWSCVPDAVSLSIYFCNMDIDSTLARKFFPVASTTEFDVSTNYRFSIFTIPKSGSHCANWASIVSFATFILFATWSQWHDRALKTSSLEKYVYTQVPRWCAKICGEGVYHCSCFFRVGLNKDDSVVGPCTSRLVQAVEKLANRCGVFNYHNAVYQCFPRPGIKGICVLKSIDLAEFQDFIKGILPRMEVLVLLPHGQPCCVSDNTYKP